MSVRRNSLAAGRDVPIMFSARVMQRASAVLALVGALGVGYAAVMWAAAHPVFAVKSIRILGAVPHLNVATLRTSVIKQMRGTFFTANLSEVKRLAEGMPWVRRAQVSRRWPNSIVIQLEEHTPFARFNAEQLVNGFGEVFTVDLAGIDQDRVLPIFVGPSSASVVMRERFDELNLWLRPIGSPVQKLTLSDRLSWAVTLRNGVVVELGRDITAGAVKERAERLALAWSDTLQKVGLPTRIDLRYPDGYAVQAPGVRIAAPEKKAGA